MRKYAICNMRRAMFFLIFNNVVHFFSDGQMDYGLMSATCNVLRAIADIDSTFYTVNSLIDYYASNPFNFTSYVGPGVWNDPDQVFMQYGHNHQLLNY